jgi:hypothetical protein
MAELSKAMFVIDSAKPKTNKGFGKIEKPIIAKCPKRKVKPKHVPAIKATIQEEIDDEMDFEFF